MTRADVVRNLNVCLRCLGVDCPAGAGLMPYEDALFFFQDDTLFMNGQNLKITAEQIESIRYRACDERPLGGITIYYRTETDQRRLFIRLDRNGGICGLQLRIESCVRQVIDGCADVMACLRAECPL